MLRHATLLFIVISLLPFSSYAQIDGSEIKLAFGSCNKTDGGQDYWNQIATSEPDLWIWLGDNIYGDTEDMDLFERMYQAQDDIPQYAAFKDQVSITGIWDDHDYGVNDGDRTFKMKSATRDLFFNFIDLPSENSAWAREGAHHDRVIKQGDLTVHLIFLDGRYFKDPISVKNGWNIPDASATLLGSLQWAWLENTLASSVADMIIIGSGIQVIPDEHRFEKWANHPTDLDRLYEVLAKQDQPCVLITGDRHRGEIMTTTLDDDTEIVEITSSSLNSTHANKGEPNRFRTGPLVMVNHYGMITIQKKDDALFFRGELISDKGEVQSSITRNYTD